MTLVVAGVWTVLFPSLRDVDRFSDLSGSVTERPPERYRRTADRVREADPCAPGSSTHRGRCKRKPPEAGRARPAAARGWRGPGAGERLRRLPDRSPPGRRRPRAAPPSRRPGSRDRRTASTCSARARPRFQVGDRVGIAWLRLTCGVCRFCQRGDENLCLQPRFTGWDDDGGYADAAVVDERYAYSLPDGFDDETAAPLLCAGIIGYRALRRSGVRPGRTTRCVWVRRLRAHRGADRDVGGRDRPRLHALT